jgi:formylmethanofuran dehydrogenase subunit B
MQPDRSTAIRFKNVTCPFCALHCDDLEIQASSGRCVPSHHGGCKRAENGFATVVNDAHPRVHNRASTQRDAVETAAALVRTAKAPLFAGLATDVAGMRATLALADATGAFVDHLHGAAVSRMNAVLQSKGWMSSTLSEIRNRADLVVVLDSGQLASYPRFLDRIFPDEPTLNGLRPEQRTLALIGDRASLRAGSRLAVNRVGIGCSGAAGLRDLTHALTIAVNGGSLGKTRHGGTRPSIVVDLAKRMRDCKYGVLVWFGSTWADAHGDIIIESLNEMIKSLNLATRFAGLNIGGNDGAVTANSVCAWQTGYPLRVSFAAGHPQHDPHGYAGERLIKDRAVDLLCWVDAFGAGSPPTIKGVPTIIVGHPKLQDKRAEVYLPVGQPGVHSSGHLIRCDSVVSLPVQRIQESTLPTVASVLAALQAAL